MLRRLGTVFICLKSSITMLGFLTILCRYILLLGHSFQRAMCRFVLLSIVQYRFSHQFKLYLSSQWDIVAAAVRSGHRFGC